MWLLEHLTPALCPYIGTVGHCTRGSSPRVSTTRLTGACSRRLVCALTARVGWWEKPDEIVTDPGELRRCIRVRCARAVPSLSREPEMAPWVILVPALPTIESVDTAQPHSQPQRTDVVGGRPSQRPMSVVLPCPCCATCWILIARSDMSVTQWSRLGCSCTCYCSEL